MRNQLAVIAAAFMIAAIDPLVAQSQPADEKLSFEVASVKPNKAVDGSSWSGAGGRQTIIGTTARILIMHAFDLHEYEISGGPSWLDSERFDINAKAEGDPTAAQLRLMMRSLLEERFALKTHRETKEGPMYRLVLARKDGALGPQLVKSEVDCAELRRRGERLPVAADSNSRAVTPCTMRVGMGEMVTGARSFPDFVSFLESVVRRRIIDETGLTGAFDITLTWSYRPTDTTRPSIFTAVQEQLGLKLESARGPLNVLIIDTIERPTPD